MKERIEKLVRPQRPIVVTPFGVDCERFKQFSEGPETGVVTIGTVKRLEPVSRIHLLIDAFARICRRLPNLRLRLLLVGDGTQRARLESLVSELRLQDRVVFTGAVPHDDVPRWLNAISVYACLSSSESFGVGVLEASACGVPVVAFDVGGLQEVLRNNVTGFLIAEGDVDGAAQALERLVLDPQLRETMGRMGRDFVSTEYGWSKCVDVLDHTYRTIIAEHREAGESSIGLS